EQEGRPPVSDSLAHAWSLPRVQRRGEWEHQLLPPTIVVLLPCLSECLLSRGDERLDQRVSILVGRELPDSGGDVTRPRDRCGSTVRERAHHGVFRERGDRGLLVRRVVAGNGIRSCRNGTLGDVERLLALGRADGGQPVLG